MKIDWNKMGISQRLLAVADGKAEAGSVVYVCCCESKVRGLSRTVIYTINTMA